MSNLAGALTPQSRPPTSLTNRSNAKPVDEFADSEINASFGKTFDAFSHE